MVVTPRADSPRTGRSDRPARPYHSAIREQRARETRRALVDAARHLFVTKGWFGTGMREVAAEAGVAMETLYGYFSSKRVLLKEVVDTAVVSDAVPAPVAERPDLAAIGRGRRAERTAAAARILTANYRSAAALARVIREAAPTDEDTADMLRAARDHQRGDVAGVLELIVGRAPTVAERDGIWALTSPEVYLLLIEVSGWSGDQYEAWIAETLERVIPRRTRRNVADKPTSKHPRKRG